MSSIGPVCPSEADAGQHVLPHPEKFLIVVVESPSPEYVNLDLQVIYPHFGEVGEVEVVAEERRSRKRQRSP